MKSLSTIDFFVSFLFCKSKFFRFTAEIREPSNSYLPFGDIRNYTELIDVGNHFNPSTGVFNVGNNEEDQGTYVFFFSAYKWNAKTDAQIYIYKNGQEIQRIWEQLSKSDESNSLQIIGMTTVNLKIGDKINLSNDADETIYVRSNSYPFSFIGYKV